MLFGHILFFIYHHNFGCLVHHQHHHLYPHSQCQRVVKVVQLHLGHRHMPVTILLGQRVQRHLERLQEAHRVQQLQLQHHVGHIRQHVRVQIEHGRRQQVAHQRVHVRLHHPAHQLPHTSPIPIFCPSRAQQIAQVLHHGHVCVPVVQHGRQHRTLHDRVDTRRLQELEWHSLQVAQAQPEKVVDRVRVVAQPVLALQQSESGLDEGAQHVQQALRAHTVAHWRKLIDQNAAQVEEARVLVHVHVDVHDLLDQGFEYDHRRSAHATDGVPHAPTRPLHHTEVTGEFDECAGQYGPQFFQHGQDGMGVAVGYFRVGVPVIIEIGDY